MKERNTNNLKQVTQQVLKHVTPLSDLDSASRQHAQHMQVLTMLATP